MLTPCMGLFCGFYCLYFTSTCLYSLIKHVHLKTIFIVENGREDGGVSQKITTLNANVPFLIWGMFEESNESTAGSIAELVSALVIHDKGPPFEYWCKEN